VPSHAQSRLRARVISLAIVSGVGISLLAPMANASASNSPRPIPSGQDTVLPVAAPLTPAPAVAAPVVAAPVVPAPVASKPTAVVAPATTVRLAARVAPKPAPRVVRTTFGQRVILEARKHFGARYRWGATGPYQFDCSGLTSYVFRKLGVRLPRTAQQQFNAVRHVSHASARVGDLIFKYGRGGAVYHVGIYAGRGRMIDAPHSGTVVRLERITGRYKVGRVR
jgi:cell wall-associated NlpC family hydrolase